MSIAVLIRSMLLAGAPAEAIAIAVEAVEAVEQKETDRRAKRAAQKAKEREKKDKSDNVARQSRDGLATVALKPPTSPPIENITLTPPPPENSGSKRASDFASFWEAWPNKVGKAVAEKSFRSVANRSDYDFPAIMAGIKSYIDNKPTDRGWLNPATFLNQRRWTDCPAPSTTQINNVHNINSARKPQTHAEKRLWAFQESARRSRENEQQQNFGDIENWDQPAGGAGFDRPALAGTDRLC